MTSKQQSSPVNMKLDLTDINVEPSDEQLSQLMKEVALEAKEQAEQANKKFFQELNEYARKEKERFNNLMNKKGPCTNRY